MEAIRLMLPAIRRRCVCVRERERMEAMRLMLPAIQAIRLMLPAFTSTFS